MITNPLADRELLALRARVPRNVVHRAFPAETVVLNLETGLYHGLNTVAGRMLQAIERSETVAEAAREVAAEFPQVAFDRIQTDMCALCRELASRGLIELTMAAAA